MKMQRTVFAAVVALLMLSPLPANADDHVPLLFAKNAGTGVVEGRIDYTSGPMPAAVDDCGPTTFNVDLMSAAVVVNTVVSGYPGLVKITGQGNSECESMAQGGGGMSLNLRSENPVPNEPEESPNGSVIECLNLSGGYTRTGTDMTLILSGTCDVNDYDNPTHVRFIAKLQLVPHGNAGAVTPVPSAELAGAFTISPV